MSARAAEYQANYRKRAAFNAQAALLGWSKLDLLGAYLDTEGQLIVIDKAGNRYSTSSDAHLIVPPPPVVSKLVTAADVPAHEFGPRWQASRESFGRGIEQLDLDTITHDSALTKMESGAATLLAGVLALRGATGPDWREALGLETEA